MSTNPRARAWLDLSADALRANHERVRRVVGPRVGTVPMVKADAYGLGMRAVVEVLEAQAPWGFGVATVDEGVTLRELGVERPVVVFSPTPPDAVPDAIAAGLALAVSDLDTVRRVARHADRLNRPASIHLEVDTGIGRSGADWSTLDRWLDRFRAELGGPVRWAGLFTHLHSAENDPDSVRIQLDRFAAWTDALGERRADVLCHSLNSAGVFHAADRAGDLVRPGIFLYGGRCGTDVPAPDPVAALRARVVHVREAEPGSTVGYGATHRAEAAERWATLAIGYGDGLPRALGNRGHAIVHGRKVPIVGRISMDVTVVNITGLDGVGVGDVATLIGRDGTSEITLDQVAAQAETISYEVLTGFTARLPRVWTRGHGG